MKSYEVECEEMKNEIKKLKLEINTLNAQVIMIKLRISK